MTLSTTTNVATSTGNGVTTAFSVPFLFYANSDIIVTVDGVEKVLDTDYTLTGAGVDAGGTVTFMVAPANGTSVVRTRVVPYTQETDFENFDGNPADVTEKQFDLCVMQTQQLVESTERSLRYPIGDIASSELPTLTDRASKYLAFDADGEPIATAGTDSSAPISAFMATVVDDANASAALTTLGFTTIGKALAASASATVARAAISAAYVNDIWATMQDFRLSLTSGVPVTSGDVTGANTIYCVPDKGNKIGLYDGTSWNIRSSAQFSKALGTLTSGKPYDVFCYDNAGVPTLEFLAWTNDTTRATALAYQDGVLVKSGAATRRYLGTFYTTSTTTTEDSKANRYLWNYYNRRLRYMQREEGTASWTYTTAVVRQANNSASNQLNFLIGVSEDAVRADLSALAANTSTDVQLLSGIGLDSATTMNTGFSDQRTAFANSNLTLNSRYVGLPSAGRHYLAWLESSGATGTTTWTGGAANGVALNAAIWG